MKRQNPRQSPFRDMVDVFSVSSKGPYIGMAISLLLSLPAFYIKYSVLVSAWQAISQAASASPVFVAKSVMPLFVYRLVMWLLFALAIIMFIAAVVAWVERKRFK